MTVRVSSPFILPIGRITGASHHRAQSKPPSPAGLTADEGGK
jgi:hypothetical protein